MAEWSLFLAGIIFIIGFVGNLAFKRTRIPEALFLILAGLLAGPALGIIDSATSVAIMPVVATLMIIVVMLDNGLSFDLFKVVRALPATLRLSICIMLVTAGLIAAVLVLLGVPPVIGLLVGFILAGTTTDVVAGLTSKMPVPRDTKQFLVFESVINDVQIIPFFVLMGFMINSAVGFPWGMLLGIPVAIAIGTIIAIAWTFVLGRFIGKHPLNYAATIGILLVVYSLVETLGGNAPLAALSFSLVLGNAVRVFDKLKFKLDLRRKFTPAIIKDLKQIETDVSFFVRALFFFFLGAAFSFKSLDAGVAVAITVVMAAILVSRFVLFRIAALKAPHYGVHIGVLTWIMPRGYVAAVLAFSAAGAGAITPQLLDVMLLAIYLTTFVSMLYATYYGQRYGKA
ncbi:MAG: cation:proton antiporter [Candidatus Aenigmarchaeota archaeon]|nr:cation:proton antiporter [Candidatus Aenigmarchaeota archaeon]